MHIKKMLPVLGTAAAVGIAAFVGYSRYVSPRTSDAAVQEQDSRKIRSYLQHITQRNEEYHLVVSGKEVRALFFRDTNNSLQFQYQVGELSAFFTAEGQGIVLFQNQPITYPASVRNATEFGARILEAIIEKQEKRE